MGGGGDGGVGGGGRLGHMFRCLRENGAVLDLIMDDTIR